MNSFINRFSNIPFLLIFTSFFLFFIGLFYSALSAQTAPYSPSLFSGGQSLISGYLQPTPPTILHSVHPTPPSARVGGIPLSYAGYLDYSNNDGYFSIPKHHIENHIRLYITPRINLHTAQGSTISHLSLDEKSPVKGFLYTKSQDEKGMWYWKVQPFTPPADKKIRSHDLVIFALPSDIYVDTHTHYPLTDTYQMILPKNIYVLRNSDIDMLDIQKNFSLIKVNKQVDPVQSSTLLNINNN